ncbi:hypothetical protein CEXT_772221 [Caerostris extrusa]|uniref:Uncharacterized protein n=1 Tax=Caerostris extrusa TaxID=172846 RepID=A0AAV4WUE8_CAEEX|nr:hypothetical protein CEXT_772221 [Caerostris extrusa]
MQIAISVQTCSGTREEIQKHVFFPRGINGIQKNRDKKKQKKKKICEGKKKSPVGPLGTHRREKTKNHLEEKRGKYSFPQCAMFKTITFSKGGTRNKKIKKKWYVFENVEGLWETENKTLKKHGKKHNICVESDLQAVTKRIFCE